MRPILAASEVQRSKEKGTVFVTLLQTLDCDGLSLGQQRDRGKSRLSHSLPPRHLHQAWWCAPVPVVPRGEGTEVGDGCEFQASQVCMT